MQSTDVICQNSGGIPNGNRVSIGSIVGINSIEYPPTLQDYSINNIEADTRQELVRSNHCMYGSVCSNVGINFVSIGENLVFAFEEEPFELGSVYPMLMQLSLKKLNKITNVWRD